MSSGLTFADARAVLERMTPAERAEAISEAVLRDVPVEEFVIQAIEQLIAQDDRVQAAFLSGSAANA